VSAWLRKQLVGAGLPAMQAAPDKALSLASQLPPRSLQPVSSVSAWLRKQFVGAGLPAMQAAPDKALSLASPPTQIAAACQLSVGMAAQAACGSGLARDSVRSVTTGIASKPTQWDCAGSPDPL
jgi:beta-lactamase class A